MSKGLGHREEYEKARKAAVNKIRCGMDLKKSEIAANNGRWFFTMTLPIDVFDEIIELSEQYAVKPSEIAETFILKGLNKGKS